MLKLSIWEIFLRAIPEGIVFMYAILVISRSDIKIKNLVLSGFVSGICVYIVRLLPIHFGFHTFVSLLIIIMIGSMINKIDVIKAISSTLIANITLWVCEFINIILLTQVFRINIEKLVNPFIKSVLGIPSLVLFTVAAVVLHKLTKRKVATNVSG